MNDKPFNVETLEILVAMFGSIPKLVNNMYSAMGESGFVSKTAIFEYRKGNRVPGPKIVDKFIAYAQHINRPDLQFYKTPESESLLAQE